jgi:hypothetical protein
LGIVLNKKISTQIISLITILGSLLFLQGCFVYGNKDKLSLSTVVKQKENLNSTLSSVNISNNQVTITGTGFSQVSGLKIKGNNIDEELNLISKSDSQIIASAKSTLSLLVGGTFDLVIGTAEAQATYSISFTLQDGAVTASMLDRMNASSGQVLKWNGLAWAPSSLANSQVYLGTWNANTNNPDISTLGSFQNGDYYIVSTGGVYSGTTYVVGDWVMFNGTTWDRIDNTSNTVNSFHGRKGSVTLQASDYVSLKDGTTHKLTGSKLEDIADVDFSTPPTNGQVLKWNTGTSKWLPANDTGGGAGIALSDLSASAPLSYNNTTGVFSLTSSGLLALPLTGLSSGSGAITATDTILGAFGKVMSLPSDYVSKSSGGNMTTGTIALSGTAMITVPTATGVTATEVANVTYVNNQIAANGNWNKGASSSINYTAGNVGIGTTTPATKLQILHDGVTNAFDVRRLGFEGTQIFGIGVLGDIVGGAAQFTQKLGHALPALRASSSSISWPAAVMTGASGQTADIFQVNNSAGSNLLLVSASGNVGIGTTTPTASLDIADGTVGFLIGADNVAKSRTDATNKAGRIGMPHYSNAQIPQALIVGANTATTSSVNIGGGTGYFNAVTDVNFYTAANSTTATGTSRMTINSSGNVGIGMSNPGVKLDVNGAARFNYNGSNVGDALIDNGGTGGASRIIQWDGSGSGTTMTLLTANGNSYINGGNVGIGTATPTEKIEANGNLKFTTGALLDSSTVIGAAQNDLTISTPDYLKLYGSYQTQLGVNNAVILSNAAPSSSLIIDATGKVGIGTATPNQQLEITKNFRLPSTTGTTPYGIIYKGGNAFIHDFNYGNNGTVTTVGQNTFIGGLSGNLTMGSTATNVQHGSMNTALGYGTLNLNTNGSSNVAVGHYALPSNTTGTANIAIGRNTLFYNTTGSTNVAVGNGALFYNTTGDSNSAVGIEALLNNIDGSYLVANGYQAGRSIADGTTANTTSDSGIYIGAFTKALADNDQNEIVIGYNATGAGSNSVVLGNNNVVTTVLKGNVGIGTTSPSGKLHVNGPVYVGISNNAYLSPDTTTTMAINSYNGFKINTWNAGWGSGTSALAIDIDGKVGIGTTSPSYTLHVNGSVAGTSAYNNLSDKRFKDHIERIPNALEKILSLEGVFYHFKSDEFPERKFSNRREMGVIAQDVEKIFPEVITKDKDGFRSVAYSMLIAPIIEAIKEMQASMMNLLKKINGSETKQNLINNELKKEILALKEKNERLEIDSQTLKQQNKKLESESKKQNEYILNQIKLLNNKIPASR